LQNTPGWWYTILIFLSFFSGNWPLHFVEPRTITDSDNVRNHGGTAAAPTYHSGLISWCVACRHDGNRQFRFPFSLGQWCLINIQPTSTALYGHLGVEFSFLHISKMVGATVFPGRPLAILYVSGLLHILLVACNYQQVLGVQFAMWSNSAVSTSVYATSQMKFGNQLNLPSRVTFCCVLWGLVLGKYTTCQSIPRGS
jgi:hypothetical protein